MKTENRNLKGPAFRPRRLFRLASKELLEILRDRRTIITLVLMPLLLYPLMGVVVQKFMLRSLTQMTQLEYRIGVESEADSNDIVNLMKQANLILKQSSDQKTEEDEIDDESDKIASALSSQSEPQIKFYVPENTTLDLEGMVADGQVDVAIKIDRNAGGLQELRLVVRDGSVISQNAAEYIKKRLGAINSRWAQVQLSNIGVNYEPPALFKEQSLESQKSTQQSLLTFVPLMLVLMTITGAVYPAIDLTAGERERGTMEILMAAPVSRMSLLIGKFVAVLAVAMLTAIFNLAAMLITVYTLGLEDLVFGDNGLSFGVAASILLLLFVFAGFFSATLLALTSFARSFKEAQAYLIPLMLVAMAPGMVSLTPNLDLSPTLAIVPLVNIVLMARDLLTGSVSAPLFVVTLVSTIFYGLLSLALAARIFGTDAVLFGGSGGWSDFMQRPTTQQETPSIASAMFFLAVLFPMFIVVGGLASRLNASIENRLLLNAMVTAILFVAIPFVFIRLFKLQWKSTFLLNRPAWTGWCAAFLMGISVWTLAYELNVFTLSGERIETLTEMFASMKIQFEEMNFALKLFCLALVPAVCEELTFRGFLMSAFRKHGSATVAIFATSILFGLFHVFVRDSLLFERMLPTTLLGLLLGYVCIRTKSVLPGMLMHVIHNGLMLSIGHFQKQLQAWNIGTTEQTHLPVSWVAAAAIVILAALILLSADKSKGTSEAPVVGEPIVN